VACHAGFAAAVPALKRKSAEHLAVLGALPCG
jgi:hypothetical protein